MIVPVQKELKTLITILFIAMLCMATPSYSQDITTGLIGHWKLDELTGTTAVDSSSGGNDGTMQNGLDAGNDTVAGKIHTGLDFDSVNDYYINAGNASIFTNVFHDGATISGWIFPHDTHANNAGQIVDKNSGTTNGWFFNMCTAGDPWSYCVGYTGLGLSFAQNWSGSHGQWHTGDNKIIANQWSHVALVYSGASTANDPTFYINGAAVSEIEISAPSGTIGTDPTVPVLIGGRAFGDSMFDGTLDDVRIYNRELSAEDIAVLASGAVSGALRYNGESEALEYHDGYDWLHAGMGSYSPNGVDFDGTNDYLSATPTIPDSKQFTASLWVKRNALSGGTRQRILDSVGVGDFNFRFSAADVIEISAKNSGGTTILDLNGNAISDITDWHHILVSMDLSDTAKRHIYVDGVDAMSGVTTYTDDIMDLDNGTYAFGARTAGDQFLDGEVADFWFDSDTYIDFSVAANRQKFISAGGAPMYLGAHGTVPLGHAPDIFLSGDTAAWHTNKGTGGGFSETGALTDATSQPGEPVLYATLPTTGLIGHWNLDETSGATIDDSTANSIDGTWSDGVNNDVTEETTTGKDGTALTFDGVNDTITVPHNAGVNAIGASDFSTAFWFKTPNVASTETIMGKIRVACPNFDAICHARWQVAIGDHDFQPAIPTLFSNASKKLSFLFVQRAWWWLSATDIDILRTQDDVIDGQWHHVVVTRSGATYKVYIDASEVALDVITSTSSGGSATRNIINSQPWTLGWPGFTGELDDVRLYNRAISAGEIELIYRCDAPQEPRGSILYNADDKVMQYCNGTDWVAMGPIGGTGGGGCANPAGSAGDIIFNEDHSTLQYCNSEDWLGIARPTHAPRAGLVGYWKMDETAGTTAVDSTNNGNDGTMMEDLSGADTDAGKVGTALRFAGTNETRISIPQSASINNLSEFTTCVWFYADTMNNADTDSGLQLMTKDEWSFRLENSQTTPTLRFQINTTSSYPSVYSTQIISTEKWYHACGVHNGVGTAPDLYLNGVEIGTGKINGNGTQQDDSGKEIKIGSADNIWANNFPGLIDEARVYNRALSEAEIKQLYYSTR